MSRAQQGAIESTETGDSATSTSAATTSQAAEQADINNNQSQLAKFAADNPYVQGGQAESVENQQLSNTADATAASAAAKDQQQATRTGQNATAGVAAGEAEQQAAQRTLGSAEAGATENRLAAGSTYGADVLKGGQAITAEQAALSSNLTGEAQGQEQVGEQAANTPSFTDELGAGLIQGADSLPAAFCPARGTLYLMANGSLRAVETLAVGDALEGIDSESQTIEEIQHGLQPVLSIRTEDGYWVRCSRTHAFALPVGGFTVAAKCIGKTIVTAAGAAKVVSVEPDGVAQVFNIITDGSHTYRANGLWSLGVGEAERHVTMEKWDQIGEKLMQAGG